MRIILTAISLMLTLCISAQPLRKSFEEWAAAYMPYDSNVHPSKLEDFTIDDENKTILLTISGGLSEQHFTPENTDSIYSMLDSLLDEEHRDYRITVMTDKHAIEDLIPNFFRKRHKDKSRLANAAYKGDAWVKNISRPYRASEGLENNHISLWQSHGRYLKVEKSDWYWQRPRLFGTTEDVFSQTFVIPYIIPMLQNAGAVVFTPRERDWQSNEVIVDNDQPRHSGIYIESRSRRQKKLKWQTADRGGFAKYKDIYYTSDAPFSDGSARTIATTSSAKEEAVAQWMPDIPEEGRYAVYVTYQTLSNSVSDARYTVHHKGGSTEFTVNQQIGGGTWVYLGTFDFDAGEHENGMVELSNISKHKGAVTADAVRFGGGMGNVLPVTIGGDSLALSGLPRWAEAAKYSTLWYGFPASVHTTAFGTEDYNNDIYCRSAAVNYLMGKSIYHPSASEGLGVPLDVNIAFHTDAGFSTEDEYVGALGVCMTNFNDGKTGAGIDRYVSRDLVSMFLSNLRTDLKKYGWEVRMIFNKNYGEARAPMTPACILEMLSHQNFADMVKGYDPAFKFDFCRSVYKTIVKFIAEEHQREYTIQPLPVENFAIALNEKKHQATLSWDAVDDPLEPTAKADSYIVYTRRGNGAFDNGTIVKHTSCNIDINPDEVYSFRIAALNKGGESFPSETLSCGIASDSKSTALIVNAFTRLEGPKVINTDKLAGFDIEADPGVPYGAFAGFCGKQYNFSRSRMGIEGKNGLGASGDEYEGVVMMGNTFDYTSLHGEGIMMSGGHSFTSCSEKALLTGKVQLQQYAIVDMIYGVQKVFDAKTSSMVETFYSNGGKLIMSAANDGAPAIGGSVAGTLTDKSLSAVSGCGLTFDIFREMNSKSYCVPSPSQLSPDANAQPILSYADNSFAGIAQQGRFVRLGFPLEAITDQLKAKQLMAAFIKFVDPL